MRRALAAPIIFLLIAGLVAATGCNRRGQIVNLDKMLMDGESWTYEGENGDLIVLGEDGSFRAVIGEKVENGGYEVDGDRAELTFVDSGGNEIRVEEWSVAGDIGEDIIITDLQGQEFFLKGSRETLR
ncbi:MAG: hypothetical protein JW854_17675 [Actinobacteria bacterium]|nr:hypothetical protein [Actinomycetota bacterium]